MALDQYFEDSVPEICSFEDKPSFGRWKSSSDAIADSGRNASGGFDCNICLECVEDPVFTLCGHLYCWPCIYKWLNFRSISSETEEQQKPQCSVCKSEVSQSSLVPLYCRGQTRRTSEGKGDQVGIVIPRRPLARRSYNTTFSSHPTSQSYHRHHPYHPYHSQQVNSIPSSYASPMLSTSGLQDMSFVTFGGMIYARVFGSQVTDIYTYPNSYNDSGNSNPRIRRHLIEVDKSLSRICFFLLCCLILCLLLF